MTIGEKIHDLRIRNNMTMDDLARELGVQRSAVNKYEKGIVINLKRSTISSLCRVFSVSSSYFLDDEEKLPMEDDETRLLTAYRYASEEIRGAALAMLEDSAAKNKKSPATTAG